MKKILLIFAVMIASLRMQGMDSGLRYAKEYYVEWAQKHLLRDSKFEFSTENNKDILQTEELYRPKHKCMTQDYTESIKTSLDSKTKEFLNLDLSVVEYVTPPSLGFMIFVPVPTKKKVNVVKQELEKNQELKKATNALINKIKALYKKQTAPKIKQQRLKKFSDIRIEVG